MLQNKFNKFKTQRDWENYRKQRNLVTSLKRKSMNKYFIERCVGGCKSKSFWPTVKPFLTNKGTSVSKDTILCENDILVNDQTEVCNIFNNFFVDVAKDIGQNSITIDKNHPSLVSIRNNITSEDTLSFSPVNSTFISKQIDKLSSRKATGHDGISTKLLKLAKPVVVEPIRNMVNLSFSTATFPNRLKTAQVVPIHKKNSTLDKGNYRPVSILPIVSKIFERSINSQLTDYFNNHFNPYLSAFRPGYGCQSTLLKTVEDWKRALDDNKYVAAILMDLSKAFDCLPHDLLIYKLQCYGLTGNALNLIKDYLSNRQQCVRIGSDLSTFRNIYKGVPQGSILGPVLFNIFINDIFNFVTHCDLYNYADDNTLSCSDNSAENVKLRLESESRILTQWFSDNHMKAKPDKFQGLCIGNKTKEQSISFNLDGNTIFCEDSAKLLGVTIDFRLKFDIHISEICKKAARQLNVLKRIGKYLCKLGKLNIYYSFILSNFNFCPLTWHFCGEAYTKKLEKIQERALRFIYEDYISDYHTLLSRSRLPSLKLRRMRTMALEIHKIIHKQGPTYLHDLVVIKECSFNFRYKNIAKIPQVRTTSFGSNSFRFSAPKLWNSLPQHFRDEVSFERFKGLINAWSGESCSCSFCS